MINKKYLRYFVVLFVFAITVSVITGNMIESNTPDFILEKYEELKEDSTLMDSIGGFKSFKYTFNKNEYKAGKELKYSIVIFGSDKNLHFEGFQNKDQNGNWVLSQSKMILE